MWIGLGAVDVLGSLVGDVGEPARGVDAELVEDRGALGVVALGLGGLRERLLERGEGGIVDGVGLTAGRHVGAVLGQGQGAFDRLVGARGGDVDGGVEVEQRQLVGVAALERAAQRAGEAAAGIAVGRGLD